MLEDRLKNPYLKWLLTKENPEQALLNLVATLLASRCDKLLIMEKIFSERPSIQEISNDQWLKAFFKLIEFAKQQSPRGTLTSKELLWINKYISDGSVMVEMEKHIYASLLEGGSCYDNERLSVKWLISTKQIISVVAEVLQNPAVKGERKVEIVKEFPLFRDNYSKELFLNFLRFGDYSEKEKFDLDDVKCDDDAIIEIIVYHMEDGNLRRALDISLHFLPHRQEIIEELREIKKALSGK